MRRKHVDAMHDAGIIKDLFESASQSSPHQSRAIRFADSPGKQSDVKLLTSVPLGFYPPALAMCLAIYFAGEEYGVWGASGVATCAGATLAFGYNRCKPFKQMVDNTAAKLVSSFHFKA